MSFLHRSEIEKLLQPSGGPCVSLFMPTVRAGDTQQNPIRFKNLLREAEKRLIEHGHLRQNRNGDGDFLDPLRALTDDRAFWEHQQEGLALFRSQQVFRTLKLPLEVGELVVVEDRFHLKPIFPLLSGDGHFYILALALKNSRLIRASRHHAEEVDLETEGVPRSLEEALGDLSRRFTQMQPGTSSKMVARSPIFAGHGTGEDDLKAEMVNYFHRLDDGLRKIIDRDAPVVLAGVEYLLPRYREASEHPNIQDDALTGNAEGLRPEELRDLAWPIVEPHFLKDRRRAEERFGELSGTGRATSSLEEILPAAHDGRVETLFTPRGVRSWGTYDGEARRIHLQEDQAQQSNGSEDLIDLAAVQTFLNGGAVFAVERDQVPGEGPVAAIFRY
jgi:hypothetical protein